MAHMNERFDDKKKAVIAKYTPLSAEELNNGAFDLNWFKSAYKTLGDMTFQKLLRCSKSIFQMAINIPEQGNIQMQHWGR